MPYCFEASVCVELGENVLDVIINGCGTDIQLIRNRLCVVTLRQTLQDLQFTSGEGHMGARRRCNRVCRDVVRAGVSLRAHEFAQRLFESLPHFARAHNVNSMTCS